MRPHDAEESPRKKAATRIRWVIGVAVTVVACGLLAGVVVLTGGESRESKALLLVDAIVMDNVKTPATAKLSSEIVFRSKTDDYFVALATLDAQNGFGAMMRSYLAFVVRCDLEQPADHGLQTPSRVRGVCRLDDGPSLWVQYSYQSDSKPDRRELRKNLTNFSLVLGDLFGDGWKSNPGWSSEFE